MFVDNFIALQENQTYISAGNLSFWDEQNKKKKKKKTSFNYRVQKI